MPDEEVGDFKVLSCLKTRPGLKITCNNCHYFKESNPLSLDCYYYYFFNYYYYFGLYIFSSRVLLVNNNRLVKSGIMWWKDRCERRQGTGLALFPPHHTYKLYAPVLQPEISHLISVSVASANKKRMLILHWPQGRDYMDDFLEIPSAMIVIIHPCDIGARATKLEARRIGSCLQSALGNRKRVI